MSEFAKITTNEYKELLDKVQFKTYFHETEWHEFLEKEFKWLKFEYYLYKNEAVLAFGRVGKKLISLPFCEYGGPLPFKENFNSEEFEKDALEEFEKNIKIRFYPQIKREDKNSDVSTYWLENLDKLSRENILNSFRKTTRHSIEEYISEALQNYPSTLISVRRCKNLKELKQFYNLYTTNLRRKKTIPYTWHLVQFLCQNPSSELLLALYGGRIVGGALFLGYGKMSHYFLSAVDRKYRNLDIARLIVWEKIKNLTGKDMILDLGASPNGSVLEIFKRGWRGTKYPIYQICLSADGRRIKRNEEGLRSSKLIRFIWSLLPNFVIQRLSPWLIKYRL